MSDKPDVLVRYVRNADTSVSTEALKFHDDDRPDLLIGEVGYVTPTELHLAASYGVTLEPVSEEEAHELGLQTPEEKEAANPTPKPLSEMKSGELDDVAEAEGVDLTGKRSNAEKVTAIEEARAAQPEGRDSLPATATTGAPAPTTSGAGTAGSGPGLAPGGGTGNTGTSGTA